MDAMPVLEMYLFQIIMVQALLIPAAQKSPGAYSIYHLHIQVEGDSQQDISMSVSWLIQPSFYK